MTKPVRLQLSRLTGFNLQAVSQMTNGLPAVHVARPSKWGNPWSVEAAMRTGYGDERECAAWCKALFRGWLDGKNTIVRMRPAVEARRELILSNIAQLRGKNLACWCGIGDPCHADVLLELANRPTCEEA